jgi:DNA-binding transcriptional LysR family regulator
MRKLLLHIIQQYGARLDRFRTMESFVRVVRAGSFTIAASQLGLSRALVSRHVSELEGRLGVRLLSRSTRSLSLTEEGTAYHYSCILLWVLNP